MKLPANISALPGALRRDVEQRLVSEGFQVLHFSTRGLRGVPGFFEAVRQSLPLDPEVISNNKWEALEDSLREGLDQLPAPRIAVIWHGASALQLEDPAGFETALRVLSHIVSVIADWRVKFDNPKELRVYVVSGD